MKPLRKRKAIIAKYKGYHAVQVPWTGYEGRKVFALHIYNPQGSMILHAGNSGSCKTSKQLRMLLMEFVNHDYKIICEETERIERTKNENR